MPISIKKLKALALASGGEGSDGGDGGYRGYRFVSTSETIKISDLNHPFSAEASNQSVEVNYRKENKYFVGFSFNTSNQGKLNYANEAREVCESYLVSIKNYDGSSYDLLHTSDDSDYKGKGIPKQESSYQFYCIKCPVSPIRALDTLITLFEASRAYKIV